MVISCAHIMKHRYGIRRPRPVFPTRISSLLTANAFEISSNLTSNTPLTNTPWNGLFYYSCIWHVRSSGGEELASPCHRLYRFDVGPSK
jgi:hypothetical protein